MVDVNIYINNGVEAFGTSGKTVTVDETPKDISTAFVAEELSHKLPLVPADVIEQVITRYMEVAARLMAEGFALPFTDSKGNVLARLYTDARLNGQNINLRRAKELMPEDVTDEASMVAHAGELVALAGVQLRPYMEVQTKFHELLQQYKPRYNVKATIERAYIPKKESGGDDSQQPAAGYALTIATTGTGTATVTSGGNALTSGAALAEDAEVELSITPADGETPTATINGSSIELTENEGVYTGSFAMPAQASTLTIITGGSSGGNGGADLDKD